MELSTMNQVLLNLTQYANEQIEQLSEILPLTSGDAANVETHRTELIAEIQAAIAEGLLPESQLGHNLAWRWLQLLKDAGEMHAAIVNDTLEAIKRWIAVAVMHARLAIFAQYLTGLELAELQRRQLAHIDDWQLLFSEIRQQMLTGASVTDSAVRALARRWQALFRDSYCGDNSELESKIRLALQQEPRLLQAAGLDFSMLGFIQSAILLLDRPQHESDNAGPKTQCATRRHLKSRASAIGQPIDLA
jgi:hypothetical protein